MRNRVNRFGQYRGIRMVYLHVFRDEITVFVQTSVFSVMIKITDNMLTVLRSTFSRECSMGVGA